LELIGPFIQELLAITGYAMVLAGVYKLYQVAADIREIKDAIKSAQRTGNHFSSAAPAAGIATLDTDGSLDSATSYAESLLRAVNAQSQPAHDTVESDSPRP